MSERIFVDRHDELAVIHTLLDFLTSRRCVQFPIREYVGIGGIGKTALLKAVCNACKVKSLPYVYVDYQELVPLGTVTSICQVLVEFLSVFSKTDDSLGDTLVEELQSLGETITELSELERAFLEREVALRFLGQFKDSFGVIMLDSLNLASLSVISFLGREIIFPLSESGNLLILLASRSRLDWGKQKYKLWRRTKSTALLTFALEYTREQIDSFSDIVDEVQNLTCGHPGANDVVYRILEHIEEKEILGEQRISDYEARLVKAILDGVIYERGIIPKDLIRAFQVLSVFRYVSLETPSDALISIDGAVNWTDPSEVLSLIGKMQQETDFVLRPEPDKLSYTIDEFVRRSLSLHFRFFDPDEYRRITQIAVKHYERKFHENPAKVEYLVEKLYHYIDEIRMSQSVTDLEIAYQISSELRKDLEPVLAGSFYRARFGENVTFPGIQKGSERQYAFDRLQDCVCNDPELLERLGDTYTADFLHKTLDELWKEFQSVGIGILEILKHYRSPNAAENEPDHYDVSFRITGEPVGITRPLEISPQARKGIEHDIYTACSRAEITQLGKCLRAQFPPDLQRMLREHTEPLIIDVNDASIPWELLHDGNEFLALRTPLGKQIRTPEAPKLDKSITEEIRVLLIGVPESPHSSLQPLKFVEDEIGNLAAFFGQKSKEGMVSFDPANDILFGEEADVWSVQKG